jgi:hypothetical protein
MHNPFDQPINQMTLGDPLGNETPGTNSATREDLLRVLQQVGNDSPDEVAQGIACMCPQLDAPSLGLLADLLVETKSGIFACVAYLVASQPYASHVPNRKVVGDYLVSSFGEGVQEAIRGLV